ncbi:hypothetical protein R3X25_11480 [Lutibacter sp. TH_r2]|uniref:hypothetical protein n=1 Tax=Lutibacter sp. TH_r2 TaxID=3082083 RepID=UPI0029555BE7|nr:hypothetical protein [Lutibacter sp. TH_r2]MDV7187903.1 hypothetical protein [Lutibacter sp. TH_r2]
MKKSVLLMLFLIIGVSVNAQWKKNKANEDSKIWRYDLECEGIGKRGSKLVKVWSYSKNPKHAISRGMKNAVHGIVFKGYSGGGQGCTTFRALVPSVEMEEKYASFFDAFFADGGEYLKYVSMATDGSIAPGDRLKVSKREYKIGVVVNVLTDALRKRLESEGIVKGLASGF